MSWVRFDSPNQEEWPMLPRAELLALHDADLRRLAVIWHEDDVDPDRGPKPWFAMTCGVHPRTLHSLWLEGLIRLDRKGWLANLDAERDLLVGRARLTPLGRRVLEANR